MYVGVCRGCSAKYAVPPLTGFPPPEPPAVPPEEHAARPRAAATASASAAEVMRRRGVLGAVTAASLRRHYPVRFKRSVARGPYGQPPSQPGQPELPCGLCVHVTAPSPAGRRRDDGRTGPHEI